MTAKVATARERAADTLVHASGLGLGVPAAQNGERPANLQINRYEVIHDA